MEHNKIDQYEDEPGTRITTTAHVVMLETGGLGHFEAGISETTGNDQGH
jgi:hypothetical protein